MASTLKFFGRWSNFVDLQCNLGPLLQGQLAQKAVALDTNAFDQIEFPGLAVFFQDLADLSVTNSLIQGIRKASLRWCRESKFSRNSNFLSLCSLFSCATQMNLKAQILNLQS